MVARAQTISPFNLPLYFEANQPQTEFLARGNDSQFLISATGAQITLRDSVAATLWTAQIRFVGANAAARAEGLGELPGKINCFIGNDPSQWQTGLPTFAKVQIAEIYPGVNLVFHGNQRQLEYDFAIAPGANPNAIKIRFDGVDKISISPRGDLILKIGAEEIRQPRPEIYQIISGARRTVSGGYKLLDARTVAFEIGVYNHSLPLVIDPVLVYSSYFGGLTGDTGWAIALATNDCVYIAGQTVSKYFFTPNAFQTTYAGGKYVGDAFIAKFGNPATNLIYLTYLGGSDDDAAYCIAVDSAGNAFLAGETDSPNFPTTEEAFCPKIPAPITPGYGTYPGSGFVAELNTNGSKLVYSTYLGGAGQTGINGLALDSGDNVYVAGFAYSTNFPVTARALQKHPACTNSFFYNANAFVTELASTGLVYSTYLGGTDYDAATSISVDLNSNVYVAGYTDSTNFPVWNQPANVSHFLNGVTQKIGNNDSAFDAFVAKFPPLATQPSSITDLVYSTFLGGTNSDEAYGIAVDPSGNAYVTGWTASTNFPVTITPAGLFSYMITNGVHWPIATNVFLAKIAPDGSSVLDSTVFGGRGMDIGYGVAVDPAGDAFVVGEENSIATNFPTMNSSGSLNFTNSGGRDVFVAAVSNDWSHMYYSVLLGGKKDDHGYGIALDASTNVFITGSADSTNFPTQNASRFWFNGTNLINGTNYINGAKFSGTNDAFLAEIALGTLPSGPQITSVPVSQTTGIGGSATFTVIATGSSRLTYQWQATNAFGVLTNLSRSDKHYIGVTSNSLTITNALLTNAGTYFVMVTNAWGAVTDCVTLTVVPQPFVLPLTNQTVGLGATVTMFSDASGMSPLHVQWLFNGTNLKDHSHIEGATSPTLTITDAQPTNSGTYEVIVTNSLGATNASATLEVMSTAYIIVPPTNQTVNAGSTASFSVVASGSPLLYAWELYDTGVLTNNARISGATNTTLTISNVMTTDAGTYIVYVYYPPKNSYKDYTYAYATLTVIPPPYFLSFARGNGGTNSIFSGSGGPTNGPFVLLGSTNLAVPLSSWQTITSGQFDSQGKFIFTNTGMTNPQEFFILQQP